MFLVWSLASQDCCQHFLLASYHQKLLWKRGFWPVFCLFPTVCGVTPPLPTSQTKTNQTKKKKTQSILRNIEKHTYFAEVVVIFSTTFLCFFLRKDLYKTVWEIKQRRVLDLAADRGKYIDQSQSLNLGRKGWGMEWGNRRGGKIFC